MKKTNRLKSKISLVLGIGLFLSALAILPSTLSPNGYIVSAGCTKTGTAAAGPDGIIVCDCTSSLANCACIIPCPPKGGGEQEEVTAQ